MATIERFEDLEAWKARRGLTREFYAASRAPGFRQDRALRDQMRRAAISITSNIAEGFERNNPREFIHFLRIAKGSAGEVSSQLYCALDEGYITDEAFNDLCGLSRQTSRLIGGLISYLRRRNARS